MNDSIALQVSSHDNDAFDPITDALEDIIKEGSETTLKDTLSLKKLLPVSTSKFYRYSGSLTTPGCNEIVVWTVFDEPISMSEKQVIKPPILLN